MADALSSALAAAVQEAARKLLEGGIVIYPTETYYALGAAIGRTEAVRRVVALKGRALDKPMAVIAGDEAQARALWLEVPKVAEVLLRQFWPGPLTVVLPCRHGLAFEIAPRGEIGVRISSHPVARALALAAGPLVATSANPSGTSEHARVRDLNPALRAAVDFVIDAGETPGGKPSTVIGFSSGKPVILREGAIQRVLIEASAAGG
jgi:L-threonylcarbamoyladenylate synthase